MSYKLRRGGVRRLSDGADIPQSADNADWVEYQRWVAKGNVPAPADPEIVPDLADPDAIGREARVMLKVIADVTGTPLPQVKAAYRRLA